MTQFDYDNASHRERAAELLHRNISLSFPALKMEGWVFCGGMEEVLRFVYEMPNTSVHHDVSQLLVEELLRRRIGVGAAIALLAGSRDERFSSKLELDYEIQHSLLQVVANRVIDYFRDAERAYLRGLN